MPLLAVTAQANPVQLKADDPLVGTWINAKYEGHLYLHAKLIFFPDGRELGYDHLSSPEPDCEHKFTIDETWVDEEGNHWHKFHGTWVLRLTKQEGPYYCLSKINASGTVREWVWSQVDYPEEMSPVGGFSYSTYYRQEEAPSPDGDVFLISPND